MQVDRDDAVGAGGLEQIGDQAGGDGLAAAVLLVLTGVGVERQDRGDALGRTTLERIDHDELFHDPLVQRERMALQHEGVRTTHRLLETHERLTVREVPCRLRGEGDAQFLRDLLRQLGMGPAGEEHQVLLVVDPIGHWFWPSFWRSWSCCCCALDAASAAGVPARFRWTHPSILRCGVPDTASAPGGTSRRSTVPAPV